MEEDLKVKATEFEDIEEVWLLHGSRWQSLRDRKEIAVRWLLCWPLPQEYFYS